MSLLLEVYESSESKMSFLKGCIRLAKCDGVICKEEQNFIINAANGLKLDDTQQKKLFLIMNENDVPITVQFENKKQKLLFIKEAIHLCYVDGIFKAIERSQIDLIANELSISNNAVTEIDKWVVQGMEWVKSGEKLLTTLE